MAAKLGGGTDEPISDINVTPFVDIVLVLLIILMVTSVKIVKASIEVDLPTAASAGDSVASTLNIVIEESGRMLLDGQPADDAAIAARVKTEKQRDPKVQAVIAADKAVAYERVMHAIDLVKSSGVKSFALNIKREARP
ncbi:MAG TPA: biopolymer transporter ExbD [Kofleriaceae bacterium]|nr:biopolymer transporter ExbD [Kofleriaceae bacterium]